MYVRASRVSTSVRAVFSHPISLPLANQALHSPSPFCLIVHPFRIHFPHPSLLHLSGQALPSPFLSHLRGRAFPHALSVRTVACELSQRTSNRTIASLPNKLFCIHFHSTSHKSLHGKPERADAAQTMSRFCKKWQKFAVVNGLSTPKRPQRCFVFAKPQVTIYRRQEQCVPHRAQPQICAKKLTIRTKFQARANCSRRHQQ